MREREQRYAELDYLKAVAIVTVVLIHALPDFWTPGRSTLTILVSELTRFAVPSFLAVSGFLYYQDEPTSFSLLQRRLRRILAPYLCVSIVAYVYGVVRPGHLSASSFVEGLLAAKMFGTYYYVLVLIEMVCLTWVLSRIGSGTAVWLFVIATGVLVGLLSSDLNLKLGFTWAMRNPFLWLPWFLLGWIAAAYRPVTLHLTSRYRAVILFGCVGVIAAWAALFLGGTIVGKMEAVAGVPLIAAIVIAIFTLGRGWQGSPRLLRTISNSTYAIYLLHPFFVLEALDLMAFTFPRNAPECIALAWASGLGGSAITIALARQLLGSYSRDVIGA